MVHIYTTDTKETLGSYIDGIRTSASENGLDPHGRTLLVVLAVEAREIAEKRVVEEGAKNGDEYQVHFGESEIMGELFLVHGVVGEKKPIAVEFDGKCFMDLGFTLKDMLEASILITRATIKNV